MQSSEIRKRLCFICRPVLHIHSLRFPVVSHSRVDTTRNIVIVVEGFVFAPEKMKRGLMRRLEGSLYTLNLPDEKTTSIVTTLEEVAVTAEDRRAARERK